MRRSSSVVGTAGKRHRSQLRFRAEVSVVALTRQDNQVKPRGVPRGSLLPCEQAFSRTSVRLALTLAESRIPLEPGSRPALQLVDRSARSAAPNPGAWSPEKNLRGPAFRISRPWRTLRNCERATENYVAPRGPAQLATLVEQDRSTKPTNPTDSPELW